MAVKYKTVITKAGAEKLAAATVPNGKKVNFTAMAVGDGGGTLPEPNSNQTKLIKEVWRHALNKISQDKKNKNYVVAELSIPPEVGGFWMREMGLYDDTGTLIAIGNMAESYKPELAEGSGRAQTLRMVIMVSDINTVELSIDTTLVMATQDYVDDKLAEHEQSRRHPDATLKDKGFTQLSSATDSTSEALAATPKAVKTAYDLATGKYSAQDATTAQKGLVKLSSATDSSSEILAATPKAIKTISDELTTVKNSLGTAAGKDIVTSTKDTTAGRILTVGYAGLGGYGTTTLLSKEEAKAPLPNGFYGVQSETTYGNAGLISFGYDSGSQVHIIAKQGGQAPVVGLAGSNPQGEFGGWGKIYTEFQKPTAADVDAVSSSQGGVFAKGVTFNQGLTSKGRIAWGDYSNAVGSTTFNAMVNVYDSNGKMRWAYGPYQNSWSIYNYDAAGAYVGNLLNIDYTSKKASFSGVVSSISEFQSSYANSYRIAYGDYGTFWRNDGGNLYLMMTNSGDQLGSYNSLRPFYVALSTGKVTMGHGLAVNGGITGSGQFVPSDYGNFDARYYTKAQSDAGYMPRSGAYTKAESDGRFQPKGSFGAPNSASKAANGWWQCGSTGIIEQWVQGATMTSETTQAITFPKAFPSACLSVSVSTLNANGSSNSEGMFQLISKTNTGCVVMANRAYGSIGQVAVVIQAKGY
ncbi:Phage tail fiber repeat protein [compost metagenome]